MTARTSPATGLLFAISSAATFAMSGIFASALLDAGWSPGAAVTARISISALVLLAPTLIMLRGLWLEVRRAWKSIVLFGVLAIAGCQLAYFAAVQFIPPSLALLIEFLGPVLLILWSWARTRVAPGAITLVGAVIALTGLAAISGVGGAALHPLGILFALGAAVGVAAYFALGAKSDHGIPPIPFVGLGLLVGAVVLGAVSVTDVLPFAVSHTPVVLAGAELPWWVAVAGMVVIATVLPYVFGVSASRLLGATIASFTGYSEPLFGIIWTIVLLAITPTALQWVGAALIIAGVVIVKIGDMRRASLASSG